MCKYSKDDYNSEPVHYCSNCLSLKIRQVDDLDITVCEDCGNTDIRKARIDTWNMLYVQEYGHLFLSNGEE